MKTLVRLLLLLILLGSCTSTTKMVMPDGCEPKKKVKYEMVKPKPKIKRDETI
jgi:hypothetical protein